MVFRTWLWTAAAGVATGAAVARGLKPRRQETADGNRWLTVTVNREPADVQPDRLPSPLQKYGDRIEVRVRPAPVGRGTELAVRLTETQPDITRSVPARLAGADPWQDLRRTLREAKALLETGEVMRPDAPPTTRETPGGKLIGLLSRRASGEGVL
ncbi:hypothetical protein ABZY36_03215 [Streptomyces sp. NPDC006627]|uniref:hypothetical protein n=1 Tax=Streptomyces sp. NPDC006627 TaxID=3154679 RepID=UPI0033A01EC9